LTDLQRTVYQYNNWSLVRCRSSAGQEKFAGERPTFYHAISYLSMSFESMNTGYSSFQSTQQTFWYRCSIVAIWQTSDRL